MPHWGDPTALPISIFGIQEFGEWSSTSSTGSPNLYNADNVYTRIPWGDINPDGAQITAATSRVEQRTAMSPALKNSFLDQASAQLVIGGMSDGHLTNLRRMLGLPASTHTGDLTAGSPTAEELRVKGRLIGTQQHRLYIKTLGPLGTRYYYFPIAQVADIGPQVYNRAGHFEPGGTFDLLEDSQQDNYWARDETT
jgi:hypothetical protein